jgi:zinc protease
MRYLILTALCFALWTGTPAQARGKLLKIQDVTSETGLSAWLVEDHSVPVISLKFAFKEAGAAQDPADKQGLARLLSNTMDEGAGPLKSHKFQKELRDLAIDLSFGSGRDSFTGNLKTLSAHKDRAFELLRMALTTPRFDEEAVDRMRQANQSRIRSSLSDPDWIAARLSNDLAFADHPYARNSGGTLSSLENITTYDLRTALGRLGRDNLVIAASGDITAEELGDVIDQIFSTLPSTVNIRRVPNMKLRNQGKSFLYKKDIPQTIIKIMQPGIDRKDPDYHTAQVMNFILGSSGFGSRLTKIIREERGLTYGIYSFFSDMKHIDTLNISTSTKNESAAELLTLVKEEWQKMRDAPVSEEDLQAAKTYLIGSLPLSLTSTDQISGLLLSLQINDLPIDYLERREEIIEQTTVTDVGKVARRLLSAEDFVTILVGQPADLDHAEIVDTIPNVE